MHQELPKKQNCKNKTTKAIFCMFLSLAFIPLFYGLWHIFVLVMKIWEVAFQAILLSQPVFILWFWLLWSIGYSLYLRHATLMWGCIFFGSCLVAVQMISAPRIPSKSQKEYLDIAVFNVNAYEGHQEEWNLFGI